MSSAVARIEQFYAESDADDSYERRWGYGNPIAAAYWAMRDELVRASVLSRFDPLRDRVEVLEIGTGYGHELAKFSLLGVPPDCLTGVDIVAERLARARTLYPGIQFLRQDASQLAFPDERFDIVCQFTCLMHAETHEKHAAICREMVRVLRPGGLILWWDVAPYEWRTLVTERCCRTISGPPRLRSGLSGIAHTLQEAILPRFRAKTVSEAELPHILPVSPQRVREMFSPWTVNAKRAGLDFEIWRDLWPNHRAIACALWRKAWCSRHCFAEIVKA